MSTNAIDASIQAVSPELIWELSTTEGSDVDGAGGAVAAAVGTAAVAPAPASATAGAWGVEAGVADAGAF
jgi:hypothetical protein